MEQETVAMAITRVVQGGSHTGREGEEEERGGVREGEERGGVREGEEERGEVREGERGSERERALILLLKIIIFITQNNFCLRQRI